jgi:hypothetical protein
MLSPEAIVGTFLGVALAVYVAFRVRRFQRRAEAKAERKAQRSDFRARWDAWAKQGGGDDDAWEDVKPLND